MWKYGTPCAMNIREQIKKTQKCRKKNLCGAYIYIFLSARHNIIFNYKGGARLQFRRTVILIINGHSLLRACLQPATNTRNSKPRPPIHKNARRKGKLELNKSLLESKQGSWYAPANPDLYIYLRHALSRVFRVAGFQARFAADLGFCGQTTEATQQY